VTLRRRHGWAAPVDRHHRDGEQAFILPLIIPAALLLILGSTTLMSRTTNSYLAASKQSDAQLARNAAESGMNRVLSALNPFAKHSSDPYLSFLLASRWVPNTGVTYTTGVTGGATARSGWRLTTLGQSTVRSILNRCGFSDRGQHPLQVPPPNASGYRDVLSGAIGPAGSVTGDQLRYMVTDYVPPVRPPSDLPWPTECNDFTTLSGGTAQISVEGRVIRNGRLVSRYTLTRTIDVQGWPLPNLPTSWLTLRIFPGPPVGLRIAGTATNLNHLQFGNFPLFATDTTFTHMSADSMPQCLNFCPNGAPFNQLDNSKPALETRVPVADIIPANQAELPRYPFNTDIPPSGITPQQINESRPNYPYIYPGSTSLAPECRTSETPDLNRPREARPNEIDCWIESIGVPATVASAGYIRSTNLITIVLTPAARYDVYPGTRVKLNIQTGQLNGVRFGTVTSSTAASGNSAQTISFTPDSPPATDVNTYSTPVNSLVSPATSIALNVNTEARPVNLIIRGNVGTPTPTEFVSIKHRVREAPALNYVHDVSTLNVRNAWNRLRIFGRMGTTGACASNLAQTFHINPDPVITANGEEASLGGSLLWLPRGALVYGTAGLAYPQQVLSVWWLCNLDILGLPSTRPTRMLLLTPISGNHDAVASVLPGGFVSSAGVFTPDLRFPVYPSLQRIRSTF
jgi:hypothetical protein